MDDRDRATHRRGFLALAGTALAAWLSRPRAIRGGEEEMAEKRGPNAPEKLGEAEDRVEEAAAG